jgi:uncharacterized membrane protein YtjA (UPF0391 family)
LGDHAVIKWAFIFLAIGIVAAILGFTGIAGASFAIAKILAFIAIAIFIVLVALGLTIFKKAV